MDYVDTWYDADSSWPARSTASAPRPASSLRPRRFAAAAAPAGRARLACSTRSCPPASIGRLRRAPTSTPTKRGRTPSRPSSRRAAGPHGRTGSGQGCHRPARAMPSPRRMSRRSGRPPRDDGRPRHRARGRATPGLHRVRRHGSVAGRRVPRRRVQHRVLDGGVDQRTGRLCRQRFLAGKFQVLVSTDAGGEGIDLQSAHVMIDWDIPWSLVRLEQRAGRLHRIGQTRTTCSSTTWSPRNPRRAASRRSCSTTSPRAARRCDGRIYDLLDATADRAGFDFAAALIAAQRNPDEVATLSLRLFPTLRRLSPARRDRRRRGSPEDACRTAARRSSDLPPTGSRPSIQSSSTASSTRWRRSRAGA